MRKVECMECGEDVPRRVAHPVKDQNGEIVGWICRRCAG